MPSQPHPDRTRVALVAELFEAAARASTEGELLELATRRIGEELGDAAAFLAISSDGRTLDLVAVYGTDPDKAALMAQSRRTGTRADDALAGRVLAEKRPVLFVTTEATGAAPSGTFEYAPFLERFGINSLLAAPIGLRGETIGVLEIARTADDGEPFTEDDLRFAERLSGDASFLASVRDRLERDRALHEAERRRSTGQAIGDFFAAVANAAEEDVVYRQIAERSAAALAADATIYRVSADRELLEVLASAPGVAVQDGIQPGPAKSSASGIAARVARQALQKRSPVRAAASSARARRARQGPSRAIAPSTNPRAAVAAPLCLGDSPVALLMVTRSGEADAPFDDADFDFITTFAARADVALEATAARQALRDDAERKGLLADFLSAAAESSDEAELLGHLVSRMAQALGAACLIYRVTRDGERLAVDAMAGYEPGVEERLRSMFAAQPWRPGEGIAGLAFERDTVVVRQYLHEAERAAYLAGLPDDRRPFMADLDLRGMIAIPLHVEHRIVGVLGLTRFGPGAGPFEAGDVTFAEELASAASVAMARLALVAERELELREAQVLAGFVQAATEAGDERKVLEELAQRASDAVAGSIAVYRLTPDGRELDVVALTSHDSVAADFEAMYRRQRWRVTEGMMGLALSSGQIVFRPQLSAAARRAYLASLQPDRREEMVARDLRAIIAVPLSDRGRRIGVLTMARYGPDAAPFTDRDRVFAEELGSRADFALARLALAAERDRDAEHKRLIADFGLVASEAADEREVLRRLARVASEALDCTVGIHRVAPNGRELDLIAMEGNDDDIAAFSAMVADRPWRPYEGLIGTALETRRTVFRPKLDDEDQAAYLKALPGDRRLDMAARDVRAVIAVPIFERGESVGVLFLGRYGPGAEPFTEADRALGEALAERASSALTRLSLLAERDRTAQTLRAMFDASPLATQLLDAEGRVLLWNPAAEHLFGFTAEEAIGDRPPTIPPEELDVAVGMARRVARGETVRGLPARRLRQDGSEIEVELYGAPVPDERGGTQVVGIYADVTERNRLQREIQGTSETLRATLDASPLPIVRLDEEMRVTFWNGAAERVFGWQSSEVVGGAPPFGPSADPGILHRLFGRLRSGEIVDEETRRQARDGAILDVRLHAVPLHDEVGRFRGALEIHEDVTERRRLEAELLQAQKMESVGRLAGGVAHDFNNILTAIIGYADLAHDLTTEPEARHALATIRSSAQRAAGLTQQLLAFSRRQVLQARVIDANDVVLAMEGMLRRLIGEDVELLTAIDPQAGSVLVDRTQLEQVVLNLAVNARDAMPEGGRLVIRTERSQIKGEHSHIEMPPGDYVVIAVTDTGVGMDESTRAHIFEPFFTTKEVGKGTGLGLSTAYGIMRQSGGYIWVYSTPHRGTTFRLYFPRVTEAGEAVAAPEEPRPTRRGRVLLVEDEPTLRELAGRVLTGGGLEVVMAESPAEAATAASEQGPFDILVTDVVMPGSTGTQLARRLREARPDLPVLFMSGYAEDVSAVATERHTRFLAKPFTPATLLRAVDEVLGSVVEGLEGRAPSQ